MEFMHEENFDIGVSMESGLEGRNNQDSPIGWLVPWAERLNGVRPRRPEQSEFFNNLYRKK